MPEIPRRCSKKGCREWQPCKVHPQSNWANNKSRPLPGNWASLRKEVIRRDGERCKWCGDTIALQLDHVIPRYAGGSDKLSNLQLLCSRGSVNNCHLKKGILDKKKYPQGRQRRSR